MANTKIPSELVAINAISGTLIADNAITSVHIAENNITATQIAINAVTALQMADGTITSAKIADGTIVTADIADGQITTGKIADGTITTDDLAGGIIISSKIANNAILTQHVDDNQITADQIADNAVGLDQMAGLTRGSVIYGNAAGNPAYLAAGTSGHVLTSDGTDISWTADTDLFLASSGGTVTGALTVKNNYNETKFIRNADTASAGAAGHYLSIGAITSGSIVTPNVIHGVTDTDGTSHSFAFMQDGANSLVFNSGKNATFTGDVTTAYTVQAAAYKLGSTVVMNSSRNLTNIGSISSGAITSTGDLLINESTNTERSVRIQNSSASAYFGVEGSSANRFVGSAANNMFLGTTTADGIEFATNNTVRATINSSGAATFNGELSATNYKVGSTQIVTSGRSIQNIVNYQGTGEIQVNGNLQSTHVYNSGSYYVLNAAGNGWNTVVNRGTGNNFTVNSLNGFTIDGTTVINNDRNLTNIGTATLSSTTNMLLTLNPTAGNYGGIVFQYGGVTKGTSIYNSGMMVYGGESGVSTSLQAGGQYGLFIHHSTRNVGIGTGTSAPSQKLTVAGGHIKLDAGMSLQWSDSHERIEQSDGHLEFFVNNGEAMTLDTNGLGIGTLAPSSKLTVKNSTATDGNNIADFVGSDTGQRLIVANFLCGSDEDRVGLYWENQGTINMRMWIADTGNLYLKSSNPSNDTDGSRVLLAESNGNTIVGTQIHFNNATNSSFIGAASTVNLRYAADGYHRFDTYNGSWGERVQITDTGCLPGSDSTYDLGSPSLRWANVYTGDLHLSNEEKGGNDIDGTTGNWTVQEGEENLYLINNKTGKKYKFALEEIE